MTAQPNSPLFTTAPAHLEPNDMELRNFLIAQGFGQWEHENYDPLAIAKEVLAHYGNWPRPVGFASAVPININDPLANEGGKAFWRRTESMRADLQALYRETERTGHGGLGMQYWNYALAVLERFAPPERDATNHRYVAQTLAKEIYMAAQKMGIANADHNQLSLGQCLHLIECLATPVTDKEPEQVNRVDKVATEEHQEVLTEAEVATAMQCLTAEAQENNGHIVLRNVTRCIRALEQAVLAKVVGGCDVSKLNAYSTLSNALSAACMVTGMTDVDIDRIAAPWLQPDGQANASDVRAIVRAAISEQEKVGTLANTDQASTALAEMVHSMFSSSNSVPVTRITIDRKQYLAALNAKS